VYLMYQINYARAYLKQSSDEGITWSPPQEITDAFEVFRSRDDYNWEVLAMGPGHGIALRSGRLVVPVWLSTNRKHRPSLSATIYSDDRGKSWHAGEVIVHSNKKSVNPSEHMLIELGDGRVMTNIRTESTEHRRMVSISPDGASDWTEPQFDSALYEPICMASIVRLTKRPQHDRNRIVFANPHNLDRADGKLEDGKSRDRKNIAVKLSYDEGKTWAFDKVLDAGYSAYSDLAVLPDGTILCLYERGRDSDAEKQKPTSYAYLTLARFNLAWLTDGKDAGDKP